MNYKKYRKKRRLLRLTAGCLGVVPWLMSAAYTLQILTHFYRQIPCPEAVRLMFIDRMFLRALMNIYEGNRVMGESFYAIVILCSVLMLAALVLRLLRRRLGSGSHLIFTFIYLVDTVYCLIRGHFIPMGCHLLLVVLLWLDEKAESRLESFEKSVWG